MIDAIGVVVDDMARSVQFYRRLGLPVPAGAESEGHVEIDLGGFELMLDTVELIRSFDPDYEPQLGSRIAFARRCDSPGEVDERYAELAADGFGLRAPFDAFWGQRYATVRDPDGTRIDLYAPLQDS